MRAANVESDIRQQLSKETDNQLKKMEEIYLLALNKKVINKHARNVHVVYSPFIFLECHGGRVTTWRYE
jgi:hypothetical protein